MERKPSKLATDFSQDFKEYQSNVNEYDKNYKLPQIFSRIDAKHEFVDKFKLNETELSTNELVQLIKRIIAKY